MVTKSEALAILDDILAGRAIVARTDHFKEQLRQRRYSMQDVKVILGEKDIERAPLYIEQEGSFEVRLRGRTDDGRLTRLVLGLRLNGLHTYVTIIHRRERRVLRP